MENHMFRKLFWGSLIILIGAFYLIFNLGILPIAWKPIVLSWQALLIVLGMVQLMVDRRYFWGSAAIIIGVVFMLPNLSEVIGFHYSKATFDAAFWPIIIIFIGILIMRHSLIHYRHRRYWEEHKPKFHRVNQTNDSMEGRIEYDYMMNSIDEIFLGPIFKGGEINNILGGVKLDLRKTSLAEGDIVLKISSVCAGITLFIPRDWPVEIRSQSVLGEFVDRRGGNGEYVDRKLIIIVSSILAGGEIRC